MLKKFFCNQFKLKYLNYSILKNCNYPKTILVIRSASVSLNENEGKKKTLLDFMDKTASSSTPRSEYLYPEKIPYVDSSILRGDGQKVFIEIYGCQMNVNDADVVWAILQKVGYQRVLKVEDADIIMLITCAIREGAEQKIWARLHTLNKLKKYKISEKGNRCKICLLGCMAERLKEKVLEIDKTVDLVAGPDSYKDLPRLLAVTGTNNQKAVNVLLSLDETYADIMPVRLNEDTISSYVSIMRGCNNMCTYCIVPFTRGRERSRPMESILKEIENLSMNGIKEVTLLGQNVNSYNDTSNANLSNSISKEVSLAKGFKTVYKSGRSGIRFAELLDKVSDINPEMRIRFTSPHPKDFPDEVLEVIKAKLNICKSIHLPAQSGNSIILEKMRRGYTREAYIDLVDKIRSILPQVTLSSDFILGFCGETEQQYQETISLIERVQYHKAFIYAYSMREKTSAYRKYEDNITALIKLKRVDEVMKCYRQIAEVLNRRYIGKYELILIEGNSRRSDEQLVGKNDGDIKTIIPKCDIPESHLFSNLKPIKVGDYVCVQIENASSQVLKGRPLFHTSLQTFHAWKQTADPTNNLRNE